MHVANTRYVDLFVEVVREADEKVCDTILVQTRMELQVNHLEVLENLRIKSVNSSSRDSS